MRLKILLKILLLSIAIEQTFAQLHPCTSRSRKFLPNRRGCSWYWRCRDDEENFLADPVEEFCENGDHFDYYNQTCGEFDEHCSYDDDLFDRTPSQCTPWKQDLIPHILYCDHYYLCWQEWRYLEKCPDGEHFSYFQNGCTSEFLADCRTEHNYCRRMKEDDYLALRSPFSCENYHVCNECNHRYSLIELKCVNGTHQFDNVHQQCDDKERVGCRSDDLTGGGGGGGPGGPGEPPPFPPLPHSIQCTREEIEGEFVIHPNDCFYFFNCASGRSTLYKCPEGSFFDVRRGQCWPHFPGFQCWDLITTPPTTDDPTIGTETTPPF